MDMDFLGPDGGKLAMAFASGCVATFAFVLAIGGFIWRIIGGVREERVKELAKDLEAEKQRCAQMEARLVDRIQQLETILLFETTGNMRQGAALAIAELKAQVEERMRAAEENKP